MPVNQIIYHLGMFVFPYSLCSIQPWWAQSSGGGLEVEQWSDNRTLSISLDQSPLGACMIIWYQWTRYIMYVLDVCYMCVLVIFTTAYLSLLKLLIMRDPQLTDYAIIKIWNSPVNRKYLQALTFLGPTRDNLVLDPLAVLHFDNRQYLNIMIWSKV